MIESLGKILEREGGALLQNARRAARVRPMTTDTERVTQLIGELLLQFIDEVPDDQVKTEAKKFVHNTLDNGYQPPQKWTDPLTMQERRVWHLAHALGFTTRYEPWEIEQAIVRAVDEYDLFND